MSGRENPPRLVETLARDWLAKRDTTPHGDPAKVGDHDLAQGQPDDQSPAY